jgi:hypothetical protein
LLEDSISNHRGLAHVEIFFCESQTQEVFVSPLDEAMINTRQIRIQNLPNEEVFMNHIEILHFDGQLRLRASLSMASKPMVAISFGTRMCTDLRIPVPMLEGQHVPFRSLPFSMENSLWYALITGVEEALEVVVRLVVASMAPHER